MKNTFFPRFALVVIPANLSPFFGQISMQMNPPISNNSNNRVNRPIHPSMKLMLYCCFMLLLPGCSQKKSLETDKSEIRVWWSSELLPGSEKWYTDPPAPEEIPHKLDRQENISWNDFRDGEDLTTIVVQPENTYQSILGIGMALEGTTLYAMRKNKTEEQLKEVIRAFIDPVAGIGLNLFRLPIGSCDFSDGRSVSDHPKGFYSYQDTPESEFSIQRDIELGKIDMIRRVQEVAASMNPARSLKFFATCWSPPPWMKTSEALIGGTLKPGYENRLARYFRQFVEAYEAEGIPIYALTMQNEPNFVPPAYPGMLLSPAQEKQIVEATYREFHENAEGKREIDTRLWINDHNFEDWENADTILAELAAEGKGHYVDAVAFHNYIAGDSVSHMSKLKSMYPETDMQLTEHSEWGTSGMFNIQQYFRHQSRSYMYWVAMTTRQLDEHNQSPYNNLKSLSPTLLIEKSSQGPEYYATPEYYLLGQFSRFIEAGALRVECDAGSEGGVTAVGFRNPDETLVVVLVNQTAIRQSFQIRCRDRAFVHALPPKTVGTYVWPN